jgi:hypothetical protein
MLRHQLDTMRAVHGGHAATLLAFMTDGLSYVLAQAEGDGPQAKHFGAMIDTWRVGVGNPPRAHDETNADAPRIELLH